MKILSFDSNMSWLLYELQWIPYKLYRFFYELHMIYRWQFNCHRNISYNLHLNDNNDRYVSHFLDKQTVQADKFSPVSSFAHA